MKYTKKANNRDPMEGPSGIHRRCFAEIPAGHKVLLKFINEIWLAEKGKQVGIDLHAEGVERLDAGVQWLACADNLNRLARIFRIVFEHGRRKTHKRRGDRGMTEKHRPACACQAKSYG